MLSIKQNSDTSHNKLHTKHISLVTALQSKLIVKSNNGMDGFSTFAHENPVANVCGFNESDRNFSIFHNDSVSPANKKMKGLNN